MIFIKPGKLAVVSLLIIITLQEVGAQPVVSTGTVPASLNPSGTVLAARWRGFGNNAQRRIYVGWGNIGSPGPTGGRQEATQTFGANNTITLTYNASTFSLTASLTNNSSGITWSASFPSLNTTSISSQLCRLNYLTFSLRNSIGNSAQVSLNNLTLNGNNLGSFSLPFNAPSDLFWNIGNFDFSGSWTLTGTLEFGTGNLANSESGKLEVSVGVRNPVTSTSLSAFCAGGTSTVSFTGLYPGRNYTVNYDIAGTAFTSPSFTTDASGNGSFVVGPLTATNYNQLFTASSFLTNASCSHGATVLNSATLLEGTGCSSLPVTFGNVDVRATSEGNLIFWTTATEVNNSHFFVEKSQNGMDWISIGKVNGQGNSSVVKKYSFIDRDKSSGRSLYRIRQVDFDGKYSFSKIVKAEIRETGKVVLSPVPVNDLLSIEVPASRKLKQITLYSYNGERVLRKDLPGQPVKLSLRSLKQGTYVVRLVFADGQETIERIVKQ